MTVRQKSNKKIEIIAAILILLFSMGLRINAPRADLPSHITFSGSILTDEGNQCHNSRSKTLFNEWYPDDWRVTNYNPILPYFKLAMFKTFGVGMLQLRSVNYIFAFFSLLFFYFILKSYFKEYSKFALLGSLLIGTHFLYIMYNKIGTFETSITFWVIMTIYFLEKYRTKAKSIFLFFSAFAAAMGFVFKTIMAYLLPVPFVVVVFMHLFGAVPVTGNENEERRFSFKKMGIDLLWVLAGFLIVWVPWYLLHYLPNRDWILNGPGKFMGGMIMPDSATQAWQNFLSFPWREQFYKTPVVWFGALLYVPLVIRRLLQRRATILEISTTVFFFAHTFMFLLMYYRPTRYFAPVMPAMTLMTVLLLERWYASARSGLNQPYAYTKTEKIILFILDVLWLAGFVYFCVVPVFRRLVHIDPWRPTPSYLYLGSAIILVAAAYFGKLFLRRIYGQANATGKWQFRKLTTPLITFFVLLSLVVNLGYYWDWYQKRTYAIYNMGVEWREKLPHAYIAGMTAAAAILETKHKTLWLYPNFVNWDKDTLTRYPITHALLGNDVSAEIDNFFNQWPERMNQVQLMKIYQIKDYFLHFYSFVNPYISTCQEEVGQGYRLTVQYPGTDPLSVRVSVVYFTNGIRVERGQQVYALKPGENQLLVPALASTETALFFLDYNSPFGPVDQPLRYEAENFRLRTGDNLWQPSASNRNIRFYDVRSDVPGFLAYGPSVPFAPGIMVVDFKLAFSQLKSKIRPISKIDIFSLRDKVSLAEMSIKSSDMKHHHALEGTFGSYRLTAAFTQAKPLEFRVQAEGTANIAYDYVDVTYYQGFFVKPQHP